ncbi:MAG: hypothetical protein JO110_16700 [Acetobacteraceae bacterium]|nr:hypothetical protein [Acetobacteraceae bacterium]
MARRQGSDRQPVSSEPAERQEHSADSAKGGQKRSAYVDLVAKLDRIYDLRRNCLLNELYYGHRLHLFSSGAFWLEILIVTGSGASGVSGWIIWTVYPALKVAWGVIAAIATFLAALKPVLRVDARIKRYSVLFSGYRQLSLSMGVVVEDIAEAHTVPPDVEKEVDRLRARYRTLAADDDPKPSTKLVQQLQNEVNRRVPVERLFYPTSADRPHHHTSNGDGLAGEVHGLDVRVDPVEPWPTPEGGQEHD